MGMSDALYATLSQTVENTVAPVLHSGPNVVNVQGQTIPTAPPSNPFRAVQQVVGVIMGLKNIGTELLNNAVAVLTAPLAKAYAGALAKIGISLNAATQTSLFVGPPHGHPHPPSLIPPVPMLSLPSIGMVLFGNAKRVLINGLPAARAGDLGLAPTCVGFTPIFEIFTGSSSVFIGGSRAARMLDMAFVCKPSAGAGFSAMGIALGALGVAADLMDAHNEKDPAKAAGLKLQAQMEAVQMETDAVATVMRMLMGKDPGVPAQILPLTPGMPNFPGLIVKGQPTVVIGGLPLPNDLMGAFKKLLKALKGRGGGAEGHSGST